MKLKLGMSIGSRRRSRLRTAAIAGVAAACAAALISPASDASAADFYTPPSSFATEPGSVIRSQEIPLLLQIPGAPGQWPGTARKVMYTSTYQDGTPAAVTGTVVEPTAPWRGKGPRPTVVVGPGTIGQGDQCAASKMMTLPVSIDITKPSIGVNYTAPETYYMLLNGVRVFVTDYIGMGTPGIHTYVNRSETGHAMLDGARAALRASGAPADAPVGFAGYSQGGGAAASAAELAATYAPELNVRASYAGAPPADLEKVIPAIDGSTIAGAIGFAINGLTQRYPEVADVVHRETNASGKAALRQISTSCIGDIIPAYGFQRTQNWTRTGETLSAVIARSPGVQKVVGEQRIGRLKPNAPVFLEGGLHDDVIPYGQVAQLAADWRAQGADVRFVTNPTPPILTKSIVNHVVPMLGTFLPGMEFVLGEFQK
ncbi:lipase family protein [Gordonia amicalis]|uniref:Lipase family protein n=1 Tax=Gordonia amicalis TaxID=89053 RepID=A0AAE4R820_9ACTN|nr:lipase family protein [Gordonia amicalis]MCZ4579472.1 lipase family protein [Gordonia amicalis]MDJ0452063.1 lipase family protein [Gordonia amicalis]MDV6308133.1 lipase family protein [Gordonia amicalis]MDV6312055.1 lipase family protein [Gordonia amicalis]MDV7076894.1 lipase family protein [Gordonia amicalis]